MVCAAVFYVFNLETKSRDVANIDLCCVDESDMDEERGGARNRGKGDWEDGEDEGGEGKGRGERG